ncbi:MAG TPA: thiamine pyrophosphate-requiring protein [Phycisphaerae bacterium]|nr:thiamine pyrophosphate-requiring protein [Phycisphaerae bacterium]
MATVSDFIISRLSQWGIERIYGYPGDGINGLIGALRRAGDKPRFMQARHEELAAFMACAHAKFTGDVGICMATSGPGAIHLLNGLYDAKLDHQPVVAIVGQSATSVLGGSYQQEVDLQNLFKDVAAEYITTVSSPKAAKHAIDRAIRIAIDQRSVTCVIVPKDIQEEKAVEEPPQVHNSIHTGIGCPTPRMIPQQQDLQRAADLLNKGKRIAILVGAGALRARKQVEAIAEKLGAGVAKAWLGKAVLPDTFAYVTGCIGLLGTKPSYDLMMDCDTLLVIGSSFPYPEFYPKIGKAKGIQIDIDGRMLSLRYPMDVNLKGDSAETIEALLPLLEHKTERSWRQTIEKGVAKWWKEVEAEAMNTATPINPERIFWELSPRLPDNCILSADSGTAANWYARDLKIRDGMMASGSGNLATMGPAVPYAVAAKICFPDRVSIALTGDGAMQMNGLNSLITAAKYWKEWADPRLICLVLHNDDLNMVTWEQRIMTGDIKFEASQDLPNFPYARFAEQLGFVGIRVEKPDDVAAAWDRALAADRPVLFEALTDPDTFILPPHITLEQAKNFTKTVLKGDPNEAGIIKQSMKALLDHMVPHGA